VADDPATTPGMDLRERRLLADLELSGRLGTPLEASSMPFIVPSEEISRAIVSGPPRFATRRRRIEQTVERLIVSARAAWLELATEQRASPSRFARAWHAWVARVELEQLNRLIDANNRYYPIEARLRIDIRTGAYITFDGQEYRYEPVDAAWLLARFPADLSRALAAGESGEG
jgi:hypothetical protein